MDEEIFKISRDLNRGKMLREMALDRLKDLKDLKKNYKIIEEYYEIIKELITSIMYFDGFKTLSHKSLIYYLKKKYGSVFLGKDFIIMDNLRLLRNNIMYYGQKADESFLVNYKPSLVAIIEKLLKLIDNKIK